MESPRERGGRLGFRFLLFAEVEMYVACGLIHRATDVPSWLHECSSQLGSYPRRFCVGCNCQFFENRRGRVSGGLVKSDTAQPLGCRIRW